MSRLQPKDVVAAQARIERMARAGMGEAVKLPTIAQRGQGKRAAVQDAGDDGNPAFKGLMALLAGIEKALVDLNIGLSMHSADAKNFNMGQAKAALTDGLADFKRGNGL